MKFSPTRVAKQKRSIGMLVVVLFLTALAGFVPLLAFSGVEWFPPSAATWLRENTRLLFGFVLAVVIGSMALFFGVKRWYVYALLTLAAFLGVRWLNGPVFLSFLVPGGVTLLCGVVLLVRFLRRYPVPTEESLSVVGTDDNS